MMLAEHLGVSNLAQTYAGRCWEHKVDDRWWFAVNANRTSTACSRGDHVPPFHILIEFNGWPAAVLRVDGEGEFAAGEAANADAFNVAVLGAIGHG